LTGVAGSLAYLAPKVLLGNYSQKVDVWAAGVLLHVLLMGTLPFQGKSVEAIFDAIKTAELDFHSSQWASVSLLAHDLIGRMLNREVSSRPNAEDVLRKFKHPCNLCFIYIYNIYIYMILNLSLTFPNGFQHRAPMGLILH
jgi:serine/threonine protein kinase